MVKLMILFIVIISYSVAKKKFVGSIKSLVLLVSLKPMHGQWKTCTKLDIVQVLGYNKTKRKTGVPLGLVFSSRYWAAAPTGGVFRV